jgi:hypothetical protein
MQKRSTGVPTALGTLVDDEFMRSIIAAEFRFGVIK